MHSAAASMVDMGTLIAACQMGPDLLRLGMLEPDDIVQRLVEKYRPPKRKKPLRDMVD